MDRDSPSYGNWPFGKKKVRTAGRRENPSELIKPPSSVVDPLSDAIKKSLRVNGEHTR